MALTQTGNLQRETMEDLIDKTGWGVYYKFLVGFTAINAFFNGFVCGTIPFALVFVICDAISLSDLLGLNTAFLLGKSFGGYLLCSVSDIVGKKYIITESLIVMFCALFLAAFSHNSHTFYVAIFLLGGHLQANYFCSKIHMAEMIPRKKRYTFLVLTDILWTFGYLLMATCYYFLSESVMIKREERVGMKLTIWRAFYALPGGFILVLACASGLLEISPRFVLFKKQRELAFVILKQFYAINRSKYSENYNVKEEQLDDLIFEYGLIPAEPPQNCMESFHVTIQTMFKMVTLLLSKRFIGTILAIVFIKVTMLFGIIGVNIFLAKSMGSVNCNFKAFDILHLTFPTSDNCLSTYPNDSKLYRNFFILIGAILIGQMLLLLIINRFGRKFLIFLEMVICGTMSFLLAEMDIGLIRLIGTIIFVLTFSSLDSLMSIITIEAFPTAIRGTAAANANFYSNIIAVIFYWFLDIPCQLFFTLIGAFMTGCCLLALFIPNIRRRSMVE